MKSPVPPTPRGATPLQRQQRVRGAGFSRGQLKGPPNHSMCAHVFINLCYSLPAQLINLSGHQTSTKPYSRAEDSNTLSSCFSHQERGEVSVRGSSEEENQGVSSPFISHQRTHVCSHSQRHWCYWPPKLPHCRATGSLDSEAPLLTEQSVRFRSFYSAVLGSPKKLQ